MTPTSSKYLHSDFFQRFQELLRASDENANGSVNQVNLNDLSHSLINTSPLQDITVTHSWLTLRRLT